MYIGDELSTVLDRYFGKTYLLFETTGTVVQKKYGASYASVRNVIVTSPGVTIDRETSYILAYRQNSTMVVKGKVGIQVYINGNLYYEKYLVIGNGDNPDGGIYHINDGNAWVWKKSDGTSVISSATTLSTYDTVIPPIGSVIEKYY